jgi:hypothetical protein
MGSLFNLNTAVMDHRRKLEWARHHYDALDAEVERFRQSEPYKLGVQFDAKHRGYIATLRDVKAPPDEWNLRIGDIVHSARSALDAITYSLACKNLGRVPTIDEVKVIQFVIVDSSAAWPKERDRRLRCLSSAAQAEIERFQPYHRTDPKVRHALSVLRDLSNIDKHRHIVVAVAAASDSSIELSGPYLAKGTSVAGYRGPLKEGTVIARWKYVQPDGTTEVPPEANRVMNAYGKLGLDVEFAQSQATPSGGSVMGYLGWVLPWIRDEVFPPLEKHL